MPRIHRLRHAARALAIAAPTLLPFAAHAAPSSRVPLTGHVPAALSGLRPIGSVAAKEPVSLSLTLPLRNTAELSQTIQGLYNPKSPLYGKYLSPAQFASRFGPTPADYQSAIVFAQSKGLKVTGTVTSRSLLKVSGPASALGAAFNVRLNRYQNKAGQTFVVPDAEPSVPAALSGKITGLVGLSDAYRVRPLLRVVTPQQSNAAKTALARSGKTPLAFSGHGHGGYFSPTDLNVAYNTDTIPFAGKGQTLAVLALGGFFPQDVTKYRAYYHLPNVPVKVRAVDGYSGAVNDPTGIALEAALDIDMQTALAPAAKQILVYEAPPTNQGFLDVFYAFADDNTAKNISISYGGDENETPSALLKGENTALLQMAAQGQTVFASSGDRGAYQNGYSRSQSDPSTQPYITSVGGTSLYIFSDSSYLGEQTWNELYIAGAATGGGVSTKHNIPFYQKGVDGLESTTKRNVPDVAAVAALLTPVDIYSTGYKGWIGLGGTSVSAPLWAGYMARVNEARRTAGIPTLGFANPALYAIGNSFLSFFDFHDVVDGSNGNASLYDGEPGYDAKLGYDNVTGFGSLVGGQLIEDLAAAPVADVAAPGPVNGFKGKPYGHSVTLSFAPSTGAKGYLVYTIANSSLNLVGATTKTSFNVGGLSPDTVYEFYLAAVNSGGATYVDSPIYVQTNAN